MVAQACNLNTQEVEMGDRLEFETCKLVTESAFQTNLA